MKNEEESGTSEHLKLPNRIHFLGIGGAGMNPLAGICLRNGVKVTGSDSTPNKNQDELRALGADIWTPHSLDELKHRELPEVCAYSTAITDSNPEYKYLKETGVQFWHRSDLLQAIANQFEKQIVISGTHGKTSTTAMLIWILEKAGLKPCWVLGGVLKGLGSYGWNNEQREIIIFEGDESDQSFLKSSPYIGLVTSLEPDHLENYQNSFEVQIQKFQEFAKKSEFFVCSKNCETASDKLGEFASFCFGKKDSTNEFEIDQNNSQNFYNDQAIGIIDMPLCPGEHNKINALGAMLCASKLGVSPSEALNHLKDFPGIYRRFEIIGTTEHGITVIDDYAHHPTEVAAAIGAGKELLKNKAKNGKLIVLFQPHLPTRLRDLWKEFTECFAEADQFFLADLYIARGKPLPGVDSKHLAKEIKHPRFAHIEGSLDNLVKAAIQSARPNDLILILGAGDITYIRETLFNNLRLMDFPEMAQADQICGKN